MVVALGCTRAGTTPETRAATPSYGPIPAATPLTDDFAYYRAPAWSPDGRTLAVLRSGTTVHPGNPSTEGDVILIDVESGDQQMIAPAPIVKPGRAGGPVLWLGTEREIAFFYFDFMGGQQAPLLVRYELETDLAETVEVCCAPLLADSDGARILVYTSTNGYFGIGWLDLAAGKIVEELSLPRESPQQHQYVDFSLSPDGRALLMGDANGQVFLYQVGSGAPPILLLDLATDPAWSPDGARIAYIAFDSAADVPFGQLGQVNLAGASGESPRPLFPQRYPGGMRSPAWSRDGSRIAFLYGDNSSNQVLVIEMPPELSQ